MGNAISYKLKSNPQMDDTVMGIDYPPGQFVQWYIEALAKRVATADSIVAPNFLYQFDKIIDFNAVAPGNFSVGNAGETTVLFYDILTLYINQINGYGGNINSVLTTLTDNDLILVIVSQDTPHIFGAYQARSQAVFSGDVLSVDLTFIGGNGSLIPGGDYLMSPQYGAGGSGSGGSLTIDGGSAASVYLSGQSIDGGGA